MSDSDENKKPGLPQWQLETKTEDAQKTAEATPESPNRETIIEQARKFLEEDDVRNATTDKKIVFLESKGLQPDEIQSLLGVTRNEEATSKDVQIQDSKMSESSPTQSIPQYTTQQPSISSAPPIITYPEFLTTPTSPSPLITKNRLLTTLYLFSGLSALLYGTHNYLITPMVASLTESRLELAQTSKTKLSQFITKLESIVSEVPSEAIPKHISAQEDGEESDEDPTEMFHRDIGVQTSPPASRPSSPSPESAESILGNQTGRLSKLRESLQGLVDDNSSEGHDVTELEGTIGVLREYLDGMAYVAPTYGYGGYGNSQSKEQDDEISRVKASIRGVKGVLLSARSFPGVKAGVGVR
ncbi:uncharacterized protein LY89DRAFT_709080 [Mollisia scopiformis]|uniref:Peroxisomal membrane protein PEX14 n=1 Tax=Mollisia scopiformis TaxID=149040 RepID=A0A194WZK7_MOLSC|nr:uncharacterized protein LY89DRAFT_709080 [Mollisia scopiformis]KUJ13144.1 hypothetical protein LY89DRAFT_709080 [Mollisia scopiformis]